jgi:hypothetical protein
MAGYDLARQARLGLAGLAWNGVAWQGSVRLGRHGDAGFGAVGPGRVWQVWHGAVG